MSTISKIKSNYVPEFNEISNCIIINPIFVSNYNNQNNNTEIYNLVKSIDLNVKKHESLKIRKPSPTLLFGKGQIEKIKILLNSNFIKLLIINYQISPSQQRNLEKTLDCKILDRTALILEIFGKRAKTNEGKIQVDLASLLYQKTRLVRTWTHLERQRGGFGFMGGPGERQIESDKRQINNRIIKLKKQLNKIELNRNMQRKLRKNNSVPIISLVGYTNVGKSSLFNLLTKENIYVKNQLFATLDTTMRKVKVEDSSKCEFILSDTVGFISNLPTELVVSFKSTLEEICYSNYIVHVIDISNPEWETQKKIVNKTLLDILKNDYSKNKIVEVWNKSDKLNKNEINFLNNRIKRLKYSNIILFSTFNNEGKQELVRTLNKKLFMEQNNEKN